ncbi:MAG: hypothetical protein WCK05_15860, partial [Planctomycetota bacterium]
MVALLLVGGHTRGLGGDEPAQQSIYHLPHVQQVANGSQSVAGGRWRRDLVILGDLGVEMPLEQVTLTQKL